MEGGRSKLLRMDLGRSCRARPTAKGNVCAVWGLGRESTEERAEPCVLVSDGLEVVKKIFTRASAPRTAPVAEIRMAAGEDTPTQG